MGGTLLIDACLGITFGGSGQLGILTGLRRHRVAIAATALAEIRRPPASEAVRQAIHRGEIGVEAIDTGVPAELAALARFDARAAFQGRGEAEVLALAATRGFLVGSDERAVLSAARLEFGAARAASTLDVLIWAVRERRLTLVEADGLLHRLDTGPGILRVLARQGRRLADLI